MYKKAKESYRLQEQERIKRADGRDSSKIEEVVDRALRSN